MTFVYSADEHADPARDGRSLGWLVRLVANGEATSRADLARLTGLSRSTVSQRVESLLRGGLLIETGRGDSTGGRRPVRLSLNPDAGVLLAADLGASHGRLVAADLNGQILTQVSAEIEIAAGPDPVLSWVVDGFRRLLAEIGRGPQDVRAVGVGVPGPVEFATGTVVRPPIMPGWDGLVIPGYLQQHFPVPVVADNDVNVMALGHYWTGDLAGRDELLVVKVGTGIGCGVITQGVLHRGADGAAGDIGHVRLGAEDATVCSCGNSGCLEAVASGAALARRLRDAGLDVRNARDVVRLARAGDALVLHAVREAGQRIGEVLAALVNFYNPRTIIIGGALAELRDELLAVIRGVIYDQAIPLATRHLVIEAASPQAQAGVLGVVALGRQAALSDSALTSWQMAYEPGPRPSSAPAG